MTRSAAWRGEERDSQTVCFTLYLSCQVLGEHDCPRYLVAIIPAEAPWLQSGGETSQDSLVAPPRASHNPTGTQTGQEFVPGSGDGTPSK